LDYSKEFNESVGILEPQINKNCGTLYYWDDPVRGEYYVDEVGEAYIDEANSTNLYSLNEMLALSDTLNFGKAKIFLDSAVLTEFIFYETVKELLDTATLSEAYARLLALNKVIAESITLSEVIGKSLSITFNENISLTEYFSKGCNFVFSESITLSEAYSRELSKLLNDIATLEEVAVKNTSLVIQESVNLTDNYSRKAALKRSFTETISFSDILTSALKWLRLSYVKSIWTKSVKSLNTWTELIKDKSIWRRYERQ